MIEWLKNLFGIYSGRTVESFFKDCTTLRQIGNRTAMNIHYKTDREANKLSDYWQTPEETLIPRNGMRSGDCEDFATLNLAGIRLVGSTENKDSSYVLAVYNQRYGHAVAVCKHKGRWVVLDGTQRESIFWYIETAYEENNPMRLARGVLSDMLHYELIKEPKYGRH